MCLGHVGGSSLDRVRNGPPRNAAFTGIGLQTGKSGGREICASGMAAAPLRRTSPHEEHLPQFLGGTEALIMEDRQDHLPSIYVISFRDKRVLKLFM